MNYTVGDFATLAPTQAPATSSRVQPQQMRSYGEIAQEWYHRAQDCSEHARDEFIKNTGKQLQLARLSAHDDTQWRMLQEAINASSDKVCSTIVIVHHIN